MTFLEQPRFPENLSYGALCGPEYQTDVIIVNSGHESRNMNWSQARARYDVGHRGRTRAETDALIAFFRAMKGRAHGFRFRDWTDYQVTPATGRLLKIADTRFQLVKTYAAGALGENRTIRKPASVTVLRNGAPIPFGSKPGQCTLDTTTGVVTLQDIAVQAGDALSWQGEFDVPCRFDTDSMQIEVMDKGIYSWGQIPIVEIRT